MTFKIKTKKPKKKVYFKDSKTGKVFSIDKKKAEEFQDEYSEPQNLLFSTKKFKEKKIPKTREVFVIQGNYGQGWEDVTEETSFFSAKNRLREYNENENYPHRRISRRVPYFELSETDKKQNLKDSEEYFERQKKLREMRKKK